MPEERIRGITLTRQGLRVYHSRLDERIDPRNKPYYWIGGDAPTGVAERGTDVGALAEGFVSISPLQLDLTAYRTLTDLNTWQWDATDYDPDLLDNKFSKSPKLKGLPENRGRAYARPLFSGSYSSFCNLLKVALFRSD